MDATRRFCALLSVILIAGACSSAQTSEASAEKVASVFGQNIHYIEIGQGPAVILLHGLGAVKEIWWPSLSALSAKYHVYAIDQLGFGHSDKPLIDYKIATWVDFLQEFMRSQNIPKASVVGNSLGGWVATEFAVQHPEMVDNLVLVDSAGLPWGQAGASAPLNPSSIAEMRATLEALFYDKKKATDQFVLQAFTNHMRNNDGYTIQRTLAGFAQTAFEDEKLKSIHAPTLIVWGRQDELIGADRAEKFRDGIPGAKLVILEECGHMPEIEKPEQFNRALLDFLAGR
jgi:2-hydroxy-6-oxonona-2,4-dienedioate hydrolase